MNPFNELTDLQLALAIRAVNTEKNLIEKEWLNHRQLREGKDGFTAQREAISTLLSQLQVEDGRRFAERVGIK